MPMGVSAVSAPDRSPSAFVQFCTSDCAPRERLEAWREIYGRTLLKLDIEPIEDAFHTDVRMRKVPGLGMITGFSAPQPFIAATASTMTTW